MLNIMGNERNLEAEREAKRNSVREARRKRREFQIRVVCFFSGLLAGVIVTIMAFAPMIRK